MVAATIDWTKGDPTKGNLVVGSPLAVAMAGRGLARNWFGHAGRHEDLNDAVAFAEQTREPLILAMVMSWKYGMGLWNRVFRADDAVARAFEACCKHVEALVDDYAVVMMQNLLAGALLIPACGGRSGPRTRAVGTNPKRCDSAAVPWFGTPAPQCLRRVRTGWGRRLRRRHRELLRKSLEVMVARGQVRYYIPTAGAVRRDSARPRRRHTTSPRPRP